MKKWICLLLAMVMCLSLAACGGGEKPENGTQEGSKPQATPDSGTLEPPKTEPDKQEPSKTEQEPPTGSVPETPPEEPEATEIDWDSIQPDEYGRIVLTKAQMKANVRFVALTTENWKDYFVYIDDTWTETTEKTNSFGDVIGTEEKEIHKCGTFLRNGFYDDQCGRIGTENIVMGLKSYELITHDERYPVITVRVGEDGEPEFYDNNDGERIEVVVDEYGSSRCYKSGEPIDGLYLSAWFGIEDGAFILRSDSFAFVIGNGYNDIRLSSSECTRIKGIIVGLDVPEQYANGDRYFVGIPMPEWEDEPEENRFGELRFLLGLWDIYMS